MINLALEIGFFYYFFLILQCLMLSSNELEGREERIEMVQCVVIPASGEYVLVGSTPALWLDLHMV